LLKATLRHRPDRIILGEIRGGEAFDLLQALNTGHSGSLSTIHANSGPQALSRFSSCVLQSGVELPYAAIQTSIASSLDFVVHIERKNGQRYVAELCEVTGYNPRTDSYNITTHYRRDLIRPAETPGQSQNDLLTLAAATCADERL
jgi:pilus assembly protein CpaF